MARPSEIATAADRLSVGCVVLSQGDRLPELQRALGSVLAQQGVTVDCLVVGNGWDPTGLPSGVRGLGLPENVGIPEGRNVGAAAVAGDVLLFLDDDAELEGSDFLARAIAGFAADPALAVLQPRAVDPAGGPTARRHIPRLLIGHPERPGDVAWFWEGCSLIRRTALAAVGGWPGEFFYGHEGIEVAWRVIDTGGRIHYAADLTARNPAASPFRGSRHRYTNARNRVWVARRNLPVGLAVGYLLVWVSASLLRARSGGELRDLMRGFRDGLRQPCGRRRPIRWRTAWRLTRLGRPPIV
ncbi:MAG TPA: glycosyltransferase [Mycobacteriales bacterium]|nr:glycosyltransferase [Mycobacteriales bacterium]